MRIASVGINWKYCEVDYIYPIYFIKLVLFVLLFYLIQISKPFITFWGWLIRAKNWGELIWNLFNLAQIIHIIRFYSIELIIAHQLLGIYSTEKKVVHQIFECIQPCTKLYTRNKDFIHPSKKSYTKFDILFIRENNCSLPNINIRPALPCAYF